ncbi:MAG: acyl-CoA thioesterase [Chloroflexota bacterium]
MPEFHFEYPVEVRYGDLDPQGHVNNANFLTFLEQARINYIVELGLFQKSDSFMNIGIIIAEAKVTFLSPILFGTKVIVKLGVTRLGMKSMNMEYLMIDGMSGQVLARAETVLVTFDYQKNASILIPELWRNKIRSFEQLPE